MIRSFLVACVLAANPEAANTAPPTDLTAYREMKAQVGRDADSHVRLALWCEAHGLDAERTKHLTIATLIDPENAAARGLLGLVRHEGKWLSPDAVAQKLRNDPAHQAAVKDYLQRRAKTADKPDDQLRLALWCEQAGLRDQATAHFHRTAQLDPSREVAWKHLGYKKEKGRWARPEHLAAEKELLELQVKANKHWKPILEKARTGLASKHQADRDKARATLDEVSDPTAVPMIWATFAQGDARRQEAAVKMLGQIDSPGASKALAMLSVFGRSADVRRESVVILKRRDPRDFAETLVAMIRKPIEYEVRRKAGLNSPGELFVKGSEQNLQRFYTSHTMPEFTPHPWDRFSYDANGLPVVSRFLGGHFDLLAMQFPVSSTKGPLSPTDSQNVVDFANGFFPFRGMGPIDLAGAPLPTNNTASRSERLSNVLSQAGLSPNVSQSVINTLGQGPKIASFDMMQVSMGRIYASVEDWADIPLGQMLQNVAMSAQEAEQRLKADVGSIESYNAPIRDLNRKARQVLSDTADVDLGDDPAAWDRWSTNLFGRLTPVSISSTQEIPTVTEEVTPEQPQALPMFHQELGPVMFVRRVSCFAAGTMIKTIDGPRPIESILPGDLVLTQDTATGRVTFNPVVNVFHNPPKETLRISLVGSDETIIPTAIHRFWKVGQGWAMARDLKPGDTLRTAGGSVKVRSVESDKTQPVFNLRVANSPDYFVGGMGILAHDNSLPAPVEKPFDRAESKELASAARK